MGGTSTDVSLIEKGQPWSATSGEVDIYPIKAPTIEIATIGAGGGSIAWAGTGERIKVGPQSAGADRVNIALWGANGGKPGMGNRFVLNPDTSREKVLSKTDGEPIQAGDRLQILTPGGGGWGDPLERNPETVRLDVVRSLVSLDAARKDYGVIVDSERLELDLLGTQQLREKLRARRNPLKVIDRGDSSDQLLRDGEITLTTPDKYL